MPVAPLLDPELVTRRLWVQAKHVVFVKGLLEASEGLASLFSERGGELWITVHPSRARELDELLADLESELSAVLDEPPVARPPVDRC